MFNYYKNPFDTQDSILRSPITSSSLNSQIIRHIPDGNADHAGRLTDSFFKYVIRKKDYDRNEVPWIGERGSKPVIVKVSAFLRKVLYN